MPKEYKSVQKYNYEEKSMKILFIIHADMESLIGKIDTCHSNLEKSSTTKVNKLTLFVCCYKKQT